MWAVFIEFLGTHGTCLDLPLMKHFEENSPGKGGDDSQKLFTPIQTTDQTPTTVEVTLKSALNKAKMVDIPWQVPD